MGIAQLNAQNTQRLDYDICDLMGIGQLDAQNTQWLDYDICDPMGIGQLNSQNAQWLDYDSCDLMGIGQHNAKNTQWLDYDSYSITNWHNCFSSGSVKRDLKQSEGTRVKVHVFVQSRFRFIRKQFFQTKQSMVEGKNLWRYLRDAKLNSFVEFVIFKCLLGFINLGSIYICYLQTQKRSAIKSGKNNFKSFFSLRLDLSRIAQGHGAIQQKQW